MKTKISAVIIALAVICTGQANAQHYGWGCDLENVAFSASFAAGATLVNDFTSPAASVRLGVDINRFVGEVEFSYLSVNAVSCVMHDSFVSYDKGRLSTAAFGLNLGVKFLRGQAGYVALMMHSGYSMQEEWGYDGYYHYGPRSDRYHGRGYLGIGLNGTIRLTSRFGLFGEARYQSVPVDGAEDCQWGGIFQGGVRFYF